MFKYLIKTQIALLVIGERGIGKNLHFEFIRDYIYGDVYAKLLKGLQGSIDKFNGIIKHQLFLILDEVVTSENFKAETQEIKRMIVNNKQQIREMYKDSFISKDFSSYVFLTNFNNFYIEEGDRRFFVMKANDKYAYKYREKDKELDKEAIKYFRTLASCNNQEAGNIFYSYCIDNLEDDFVPFEKIYDTDEKKYLQDLRAKSTIRFIKQFDFDKCGEKEIDGKIYKTILSSSLYSEYITWFENNHLNGKPTANNGNFSKEISEYVELKYYNTKKSYYVPK